MSSDDEKGLDVTYDQISGFLEISKSKELYSKELLKYILKNDVACSDDTLTKMCELFSVSVSINKFLQKFLEMENVNHKTVFRMTPNSVLTMSTLMVNLVTICESLRPSNYSFEVH